MGSNKEAHTWRSASIDLSVAIDIIIIIIILLKVLYVLSPIVVYLTALITIFNYVNVTTMMIGLRFFLFMMQQSISQNCTDKI